MEPAASAPDAPAPVDGPAPTDLRGIGRRFGAWWRVPSAAEAEGALDRAVVSWHPGYAAAVGRVVQAMHDDVERVVEAERTEVLTRDADARDTVAPASWRKGLRLLGFLGSACALATAITALLFAIGARRGIDPLDVGLVTAIGSVVALLGHGVALLPPGRAGTPSRTTSFLLELATIATVGGAVALWARREAWDASAAVQAVATGACALALALLTTVVIVARMRLAAPRRRAQAEAEARLRAMVPAMLAERLSAAPAAIEAAWAALHPDTRAVLERERAGALGALGERGIRLDDARLRATTPGILLLPAAADAAWSRLHPADAFEAHRRAGSAGGHFVRRAHRRRLGEGPGAEGEASTRADA